MPFSADEISRLTTAIEANHGETSIALACLVHLATSRLQQHGPGREAGLKVLHDLGMACVRVYAHRMDVPWGEVKAAIAAIERAGRTASYLHTLPD